MTDAADTPLVRRGWRVTIYRASTDEKEVGFKTASPAECAEIWNATVSDQERKREYLLLPLTPAGEIPEELVERVAFAQFRTRNSELSWHKPEFRPTRDTYLALARAALRALGTGGSE